MKYFTLVNASGHVLSRRGLTSSPYLDKDVRGPFAMTWSHPPYESVINAATQLVGERLITRENERTMTTDRILDKLQKIKAHAESAAAIGNEAEAQAFAEMLNTLLMKHKLEMTDLEFTKQDETSPVDRSNVDFAGNGVKVRNTRIAWIEKLASLIARNHCCRILVHPGSSHITLVGRREDRAVAEYMIVTLTRATEQMAKKEHQKYCWQVYQRDGNCSAARGFKESFITGFIRRLFDRFEELKRQREGENTSTALMRINKDDAAAQQYIDNLKTGKASALARLESHNGEGYRRGIKAANEVNLKANAIDGSAPTVKGSLR